MVVVVVDDDDDGSRRWWACGAGGSRYCGGRVEEERCRFKELAFDGCFRFGNRSGC